MKWPALAAAMFLSASVAGCDKIPFVGTKAADTTALDTATALTAAPMDTAAAQQVPPPEPPAAVDTQPARPEPRTTPPQEARPTQRAAEPARRVTAAPAARTDEPWTPRFTGTVDPGMTADEVIAQWGPPAARSSTGQWTYLYFRNGCEVSCGMLDVVLLQDGQVVDAVVRAPGHTYSGVSSSPPGRPAMYTPPGTSTGEVGAQE